MFVLMAIDFSQALVSLYDMKTLLQDLKALVAKMPHPVGSTASVLDAAARVIEKDSRITRHGSLQAACRQYESLLRIRAERASSLATEKFLKSKTSRFFAQISQSIGNKVAASDKLGAVAASKVEVHQPREQSPAAALVEGDVLLAQLGLDEVERLELVQKTAKVLYMTEFAVLVEYIEVVTPVIYSMYILIMFYLPNRAFYPQLAELSQSQLFGNVSNVFLYAGLELLSLLVTELVIRRQLGFSPIHQLTFVLKTQWATVQAKFMLWVMYVVQTYLYHSGADFSFRFKWLSQEAGTPPS